MPYIQMYAVASKSLQCVGTAHVAISMMIFCELRKVIKFAKNCREIIVLNDFLTSYQLRSDKYIKIYLKNESVVCVKLLLRKR